MSTPFEQSAASQEAQEDVVLLLDKAWEDVQQRTFTKWINTKLALRNIPPIENMDKLCDGTVLIQLLEVIGDTSLGRFNKNPRLKIQQVENNNKALEFIKYRGINLTNIGAEDIVDNNTKLILGMIWTIILRFTISDINQEGLTAKEGLLLWCQRKTARYDDVNVRDFTYSWTDGLALCALIHCHRPDLLDYHSLDKSNRHANTALAFDIAEEKLNIPKLLDVADVCDISKPDERSVMTYVAQYFHAFSALGKMDTAARRVTKFADMMKSSWEMQSDYETRVKKLIVDVQDIQSVWRDARFDGSYADAKRQSAEFASYKNNSKRNWITEKLELEAMLGNIQTKLRTYNLKQYAPPAGLTIQDLEREWQRLVEAEVARRKAINKKIREIKETLEVTFARLANDLQANLNGISATLSAIEGDLKSQLNAVNKLNDKLNALETSLEKVRQVDRQCQEANIDENDHTVYSLDDIVFDLSLVRQALTKKAAFIENQIVSRNVTNLTPAQLEEFESAFRFFDKDDSNTLTDVEFKACLAGLDFSYSDEEFAEVFQKCAQGEAEISFERFSNFMVSIIEDTTTPDQLRESFKAFAGEKEYITELELTHFGVPVEATNYLAKAIPPKDGDTAHLDYAKFLDNVFAS